MTIRRHTAPAGRLTRGVLISTPHDSDKKVEQSTVQCVHCLRVWLWQPGSGRVRGWCARCNGLTCGPGCGAVCVHFEQLLENLEKGMPYELARLFAPIIVSVPAAPPGG